MLSTEQHLDNLVRHIELVRDAGLRLGRLLITKGRVDLGRLLIARVFKHDISKFRGIEWQFLHVGSDVPEADLQRAIKQHRETNRHHPEYHGGFDKMDELDVAEMVCDCYARSQEFGSSVRDLFEDEAIKIYNIDKDCTQYRWVQGFLGLLLEEPFKRAK